MASLLANKTALPAACKPQASRRSAVVVRAQRDAVDMSRRASLASLAGAAAVLTASPAFAAYGDSANVFGEVTNKTGYVPFAGEGFAVTIPSKWNPSKEQDVPGTLLRYEDNYFPVNNFVVAATPTDKASISAFGPPEKFLEQFSSLLGKQAYSGETISEGGFAPNRVSAASILDLGTTTDKKGKEYYTIELLSRTADGNEGGRHQLIKATVAGGKLWVLLVRAGDKRWFKTTSKECKTLMDSFIVA